MVKIMLEKWRIKYDWVLRFRFDLKEDAWSVHGLAGQSNLRRCSVTTAICVGFQNLLSLKEAKHYLGVVSCMFGSKQWHVLYWHECSKLLIIRPTSHCYWFADWCLSWFDWQWRRYTRFLSDKWYLHLRSETNIDKILHWGQRDSFGWGYL